MDMVNEYFENFFLQIRGNKYQIDNVFAEYLIQEKSKAGHIRKRALNKMQSDNQYLYETFMVEMDYVKKSKEAFYWGSMYYASRSMSFLSEGYKIPFVEAKTITDFYEEEIDMLSVAKRNLVSHASETFRNLRMKEMFIAMYKDRKNSNIIDSYWKVIVDNSQGGVTPWIRPLLNVVLLMHRQQDLTVKQIF